MLPFFQRSKPYLVAATLLISCSSAGLRASDQMGEGFSRRLHWQGKVKGETVTMDIEAGKFVAAEHRVEKKGGKIDGYRSLPSYLTTWGNDFPFFIIKKWTVRWGGKRVVLPRGVYTSIFTPDLRGLEPYFSPYSRKVSVTASDNEDALVVKMGCGYDGVTPTVVFVIAKDGRVQRFVMSANS